MDPVSIEHETILSGPFSIDQLIWIGGGLGLLLLILAIRDYIFAQKKWIVPLLFLFRLVAIAGILLALAAPAEQTRETFETGQKKKLDIYLDTSASMRLQDPVDEKGHLRRWQISTRAIDPKSSILSAIEEAHTRVTVSRAVLNDSVTNQTGIAKALQLQKEELQKAFQTVSQHANTLPYPELSKEIITRADTALNKTLPALIENPNPENIPPLLNDISGIAQRIAVISREQARREEVERPENLPTPIPSRLQWADVTLQNFENRLNTTENKDFEINRYQFADSISPAPRDWNIPTTGEGDTNLNAVLNRIHEQHRADQIEAAFVITDGIHNAADRENADIPDGLKEFPLFIIPAGGDYQINDTTLWRATAPETISQGDFLSVDCLVGSRGFSGQSTQLRLLENGEELDSVEIHFGADNEDQRARLTTKVKSTGNHRYEVELVAPENEEQTLNNRTFIDVKSYTGDLNVLLVDGWPRWESRYLSNLLKRDDQIKHREILYAPVPPFPFPNSLSSPERLKAYQIVVVGEVGPEFIGAAESIALEKYVNNGGNLIVISGSQSMPAAFTDGPFSKILPIKLDEKRLQTGETLSLIPSQTGKRIAALKLEDNETKNEAVWKLSSRLLSLTELSPFNLPKPGAQVILEAKNENGESIPYITWHRYGAGRVFYFSSPTTYHLRYRFGDRYHYRFWGQFLRWATVAELVNHSALVDLSTDEKRYQENDQPVVRAEVFGVDGNPIPDAKIKAEITSSGGIKKTYSLAEQSGNPGFYTATLPPLKHGEYNVTLLGPTVDTLFPKPADKDNATLKSSFSVEALPNTEDRDRKADLQTAYLIAEQTGGAVIAPSTMATAIEILSRNTTKTSREKTSQKPLWNRWSLFALILTLLCIEWAGRKYAGLI